jgi:hypothetical protein
MCVFLDYYTAATEQINELLVSNVENTFKAECDVLAPRFECRRGYPYSIYVYRIERSFSFSLKGINSYRSVLQFQVLHPHPSMNNL